MDDVSLSQLQKATTLKDTSGVAQQLSKASNAPISNIGDWFIPSFQIWRTLDTKFLKGIFVQDLNL